MWFLVVKMEKYAKIGQARQYYFELSPTQHWVSPSFLLPCGRKTARREAQWCSFSFCPTWDCSCGSRANGSLLSPSWRLCPFNSGFGLYLLSEKPLPLIKKMTSGFNRNQSTEMGWKVNKHQPAATIVWCLCSTSGERGGWVQAGGQGEGMREGWMMELTQPCSWLGCAVNDLLSSWFLSRGSPSSHAHSCSCNGTTLTPPWIDFPC